ncbi:unnamed protein product [Cylicocyclus nassatus]|uniref:Uncharacterized protein n=1 Tax=Cylicocyclus nassatus TaxID=53992 RepID=A0AA36H4N3_CYLNA|nr:unnamed protein product [Cylicocyclus nassatus]
MVNFVIFTSFMFVLVSVAYDIDYYGNSTRESKKVTPHEVMENILSPSYDSLIRPPVVDDMENNMPAQIDVQCYVRR